MLSLQVQAIQRNACRTLGPPYQANGLARACQLQAGIRPRVLDPERIGHQRCCETEADTDEAGD